MKIDTCGHADANILMLEYDGGPPVVSLCRKCERRFARTTALCAAAVRWKCNPEVIER